MELFPRFQRTYIDLSVEKSISNAGLNMLENYSEFCDGTSKYIDFVKYYGLIHIKNRAFNLVDPIEYVEDLKLFLPNIEGVVFARSSFGNLYFISNIEKAMFVLHPMYDWYARLGANLEIFFESSLVSASEKLLRSEQHNFAISKLGFLKDNEIFGFEPALALGGNEENLDSIKKFEIHSHLAFLSQLVTVERR